MSVLHTNGSALNAHTKWVTFTLALRETVFRLYALFLAAVHFTGSRFCSPVRALERSFRPYARPFTSFYASGGCVSPGNGTPRASSCILFRVEPLDLEMYYGIHLSLLSQPLRPDRVRTPLKRELWCQRLRKLTMMLDSLSTVRCFY